MTTLARDRLTLRVPRRIDAAVARLTRPRGMTFDFATPVGEPALVGPGSVSWRIFKNNVAMFVGGIAAVLLELAEPRVRAGVWDHSSFRSDPLTRLQRTGLAAMVTVYGARSTVEAMTAGVRAAHERVRGITDAGVAYRANDPDLLDWVQATAAFGFLEAYAAYVRPVSAADRDLYYAEGAPAARLYGAQSPPSDEADLTRMFAAMAPALEPSPVIGEFLAIMRAAPILPAPMRPIQRLLIRAAIDILPGWSRDRLGLGRPSGLRRWQRPLVRAIGRAADRLMLRSGPPVQASLRLGLPADHLYR